jgi:hypothetical protein
MPHYSPDFVQTMRSALDAVVTKIPADQATSAVRAKIAELILQTAAEGQRSYEGNVRTAESAGIPRDKALSALTRTWLRLAEEAEAKRADMAR